MEPSDLGHGGLLVSVVLNWRSPEMTVSCVEALQRSADVNHRVVVVDNASGDGSAEALRRKLAGVTILESQVNLGFSGGCNIGIRWALDQSADYIALVNSDLTISPGSLKSALSILSFNPSFGAVTGKIFSAEQGILWQAGGSVSHLTIMGRPRAHFALDDGRYDKPCTTEWTSGALSVFRANALHEVGLLCAKYFFGQEEWDVSTSLIKAGYAIGYDPAFVGVHNHGSSYTQHPALNSYGAIRNRRIYAARFLSRPQYLAWYLVLGVYIRTLLPIKMRLRHSHDRQSVHLRAMRLGWHRNRALDPVTLDELIAVSEELAIPSSWAPLKT